MLPFLAAVPVGCILVDDCSFAVQLNEMSDFDYLAFDSVVDGAHFLHDLDVGAAKVDNLADDLAAREEFGELVVAVDRLVEEVG